MNRTPSMTQPVAGRALSLALTARDLPDRLLRDETGQAITEYSMILVCVAVVAVAVLGLLGSNIAALFQPVIDAFRGI